MTSCSGTNSGLKGIIVFLALFFTFSDGFGQEFPSELLHEGELVLLSGDTLKGQIKYNLENDLIQIVINETVQTYSARKIRPKKRLCLSNHYLFRCKMSCPILSLFVVK
jgi:hypothetical protein